MRISAQKLPQVITLALGVILVGIGIFIASQNTVNLVQSSVSFASEPVEVQGFNETEVTAEPRRILIPEIGIDLDVEVSEIVNGYWEVHEDKAGWGMGSGVPSEIGNQVIFAHARKGLFGSLDEIKVNSKVYVLSEKTVENEGGTNFWNEYEVTEIKEVYPNQTEVIKPVEDKEILTLYTCSGFNDNKRLIVIAEPVE